MTMHIKSTGKRLNADTYRWSGEQADWRLYRRYADRMREAVPMPDQRGDQELDFKIDLEDGLYTLEAGDRSCVKGSVVYFTVAPHYETTPAIGWGLKCTAVAQVAA